MKTILVPVDFSTPSENALRVATNLAKRNHAKIIVLHVMEIAEPLMGTGQYYVDDQKVLFFMKLGQKKFREFLDKDFLKNVTIADQIEIGSTADGIARMADKNNADLIVMGSKGSSGLEEVLIGSNTEKVVRNSKIPVLVIKNEMKDFDIRRMVFASDFGLENLTAYRKAKTFAMNFNSELKLLYINTPGDKFKSTNEIREKMRGFLNNTEIPYSPENIQVFNDYSVDKGVLNAANYLSADLIAMPTHGRKGLAHFFSGSIAEDVTNHSQIPVITFKIEAE